jgi:hypothetical protein
VGLTTLFFYAVGAFSYAHSFVSMNVKLCGQVVATGPYPGRKSGEHIKLYLHRRTKKGISVIIS